jgi:hypothetical protein
VVKVICKEDCGNAPKKLFLKDFNTAVARGNLPFIEPNITEDVTWHLFEPSGQKQILGRDNVLEEYKHNLVIEPVELAIDTIITQGDRGAVNGTI